MKALPLILLLGSCSGTAPAPDGREVDTLRRMLALAAGDGPDLRASLATAAATLADPRDLVEELTAAAARQRRRLALERELKELRGVSATAPGGPAWLRDRAGDASMGVFDRLVTVDLNDRTNPHAKEYRLNPRVNDAWLERLAGFEGLRKLDLGNMDIRGPGLRHLRALAGLESLNLTLTPVGDVALDSLSNLTALKVLGLASTPVTGSGMSTLGSLTRLENLNLHSSPVNDAGLAQIGKLKSLVRLEIVHTKFTDAGTPALAGLLNLERLQLGSRTASGAGLAFLRELPKLRELDVHDALLSAEGFRHVGAARSLRVLRAYGGPGGEEGLAALAGLVDLETLILDHTGAVDANLDILAKLPRLKKLELREPKLSEAAVARLMAALPLLDLLR